MRRLPLVGGVVGMTLALAFAEVGECRGSERASRMRGVLDLRYRDCSSTVRRNAKESGYYDLAGGLLRRLRRLAPAPAPDEYRKECRDHRARQVREWGDGLEEVGVPPDARQVIGAHALLVRGDQGEVADERTRRVGECSR